MNTFLQLLINGILLGGFYATMALGFANIWGVMRLINLAHGEFLLLAAFVGWFFFNPNREQNLAFPPWAVEKAGFSTYLLIGSVWLLVGWIISEAVIGKKRLPDVRWRRGGSLTAALVLGTILTLLWRADDFQPLSISMMALVMIGLALSIGVFISQFWLGMMLGKTLTWQHYAASYGTGVLLVGSFYVLWQRGGFDPIDPFVALPLAFLLFFGIGFALQKNLFNRLVEAPYLTMLLVTFGIAIILQDLMLEVYAADPRKINVDYGTAIELGTNNLTVAPIKLYSLLVSTLMIAGLILFLRYTHTGYAVRAAAQNKMAAKLVGININEVYAITFGISLGLTAVAGVMMGTFQPITPVSGSVWTLRAFSIVALGGLGKVEGVIVGGLLLGIAESFVGGYVAIGWAVGTAFLMLVIMLILRPQGIVGGQSAVEE